MSKIKLMLKTVVAFASVSAHSVFAAVPAEVTTAQSDGKADAIVIATGGLLIVIAISVYKYMKRGA